MRFNLLKLFCLMISGTAMGQTCPAPALGPANNHFAFDIYKQLLQEKGPTFFSPYSIFSALQMTADGARGTTATEMLQVLHTKGNLDCIHSDIKKSQQQYKSLLAKGDSVHIANSLWIESTFPVNTSFVSQANDWYNASLQNVDFKYNPDPSRKKINTWVEVQTHNRIKNLLAAGTITPLTRLVLVNAIWLKAKWMVPFKHENTRDDAFYSPGKQLKVPFMNNTTTVNYGEDEIMQIIEMPYQSNKLSMIVMLPVEGKEADFSKKFTEAQANKWINSMTMQRTRISLPKFKLNASFMLSDVLMKMGMQKAFADGADFSGISNDGLKISEVIHKAFIEVDEAGTEAAAATAVIMVGETGMPRQEIPPKIFNADHPFIFLLYDKENKTILFMGKMDKPE